MLRDSYNDEQYFAGELRPHMGKSFPTGESLFAERAEEEAVLRKCYMKSLTIDSVKEKWGSSAIVDTGDSFSFGTECIMKIWDSWARTSLNILKKGIVTGWNHAK